MRIEFSGGAGTVTGSSHLLRVKDKRVLLDCGLYQGRDEKDRGNDVFAYIPSTIDYLILSHAHIDHSGRIQRKSHCNPSDGCALQDPINGFSLYP